MSRDMKPRRQNKAAVKKKSGGGTLLGLFIGLVVGVLVAAGVVWYINKMPMPFAAKGQPPQAGNSKPQQAGVEPVVVTPVPLPGKPGDPVPQNGDKPRFDFYKILPGNADAIPDPKPEVAKAKVEKEGTLKEALFLQTGSFQSAADADNQKAKLALTGLEASVQQVMVQDKVWFRVRLGPFSSIGAVNSMRADLAKLGIEANVVKKD